MEIEKYNIPVVLITKAFPYDILKSPAENYLINEIKYLSKLFNTVYVISTDSRRNDRITVSLPDNVIAIKAAESAFLRYIDIFVFSAKHFFDFATYENQNIGIKKRIKYAFFRGKGDYYYRLIRKYFISKRYVSTGQSILLYTFWFYTYTLAATMLKKRHFSNALIITRAHRYDLYAERNALKYLPLREYLLSNIDKVFACSRDGQNYLSNKYPEFNSKIASAYLGVEDHGIRRYQPEGTFTVVSCSRVEPVKRLELLAESMIYLHRIGKKIKWIHIGDGSQFNRIQQLAKELLDLNVACFYGALDNERVYEIYKTERIDLFVNVSESEGLPISMMEASNVGLPILATDVGGVCEIVDDTNGWLVPASIDCNQLASKIIEISELPPELLTKKGKNSREKWRIDFCIENNLNQMIRGVLHEE